MEQASGRIMTGIMYYIRAISAHLPLTSLIILLLVVILLWPSTAFGLFVYQYYIIYTIYYSYSLSGEYRCLVPSVLCLRRLR